MEVARTAVEWAGEHLGWLFGLPLGAFIAYILVHAFVLAPRRARQAMLGLASRGYAPGPTDAPALKDAIRTALPIYALELPQPAGGRSSASPNAAMVQHQGRHTRYVLDVWRSYWLRAGRPANTRETVFVEVGDTGLEADFEVSPFAPERVAHGLAPVTGVSKDLSAELTVYAREATGLAVPARLQDALREVAPILREGLATKSSAGIPRQVVGLRFTPAAWAISCNPLLTDESELAQLLRVADTIRAALS